MTTFWSGLSITPILSHPEACLPSLFQSQPLTQFSNLSQKVLADAFLHLLCNSISLVPAVLDISKAEFLTTSSQQSLTIRIVPQTQIFTYCFKIPLSVNYCSRDEVQDLLHAKWGSFPLVASLCLSSSFSFYLSMKQSFIAFKTLSICINLSCCFMHISIFAYCLLYSELLTSNIISSH